MLSRTRLFLVISRFTLFMRDNAQNPILKGLPIPQRGKKLSEMYANLSNDEWKTLGLRARRKSHRRIIGARNKKPKAINRGTPPFATFVKARWNEVSGSSPRERMKNIAELWKRQKQ